MKHGLDVKAKQEREDYKLHKERPKFRVATAHGGRLSKGSDSTHDYIRV